MSGVTWARHLAETEGLYETGNTASMVWPLDTDSQKSEVLVVQKVDNNTPPKNPLDTSVLRQLNWG